MKIEEIISTIEDKAESLTKEELIKLWNLIFPEEKIFLKDITDEKPLKEKQLKEEICSMLIDEISSYDTKSLLKIYNKLTEENLTIDDLDETIEEIEDTEEEEL